MMSLTAVATLVILRRVAYENKKAANDADADESKDQSFAFLLTYLLELVMVYACWYPMLSTLFFSGAIWPIFPCIGGRPKELKRQKDEAQRNAQKMSKIDKELV